MSQHSSRLPVAGISAAIVFAVGLAAPFSMPGGGNVTEKEFTDFYNSSGHRAVALLLGLVLVAGCWLMQWFFVELQATLPTTGLTEFGRRAVNVGTAGVIFGMAIMLAPVGVQVNSNRPYVGMPIAHTFAQAGWFVAIFGGFFSFALAVFLLSLQARRSAAAPGWVSASGMAVAVLMLSAYVGIGMVLLPLWVLAASLGLRRAPAAASGRVPLGAAPA